MKRPNDIEQTAKQTEKQHLILRLRLAMALHRYDIVQSLSEELKLLIGIDYKIDLYPNNK